MTKVATRKKSFNSWLILLYSFNIQIELNLEMGVSAGLEYIYRGSHMSSHVLLNLLNELGKRDKIFEACRAFYLFFATSLINSIIQEHEC